MRAEGDHHAGAREKEKRGENGESRGGAAAGNDFFRGGGGGVRGRGVRRRAGPTLTLTLPGGGVVIPNAAAATERGLPLDRRGDASEQAPSAERVVVSPPPPRLFFARRVDDRGRVAACRGAREVDAAASSSRGLGSNTPARFAKLPSPSARSRISRNRGQFARPTTDAVREPRSASRHARKLARDEGS